MRCRQPTAPNPFAVLIRAINTSMANIWADIIPRSKPIFRAISSINPHGYSLERQARTNHCRWPEPTRFPSGKRRELRRSGTILASFRSRVRLLSWESYALHGLGPGTPRAHIASEPISNEHSSAGMVSHRPSFEVSIRLRRSGSKGAPKTHDTDRSCPRIKFPRSFIKNAIKIDGNRWKPRSHVHLKV